MPAGNRRGNLGQRAEVSFDAQGIDGDLFGKSDELVQENRALDATEQGADSGMTGHAEHGLLAGHPFPDHWGPAR